MKASEALAELAVKTKAMEDRTAKAQAQQRAQLEKTVEAARKSADEHAEQARMKARQTTADADRRWSAVQDSWKKHLTGVHKDMQDKKAAVDLKIAQKQADMAEGYALDVVDFAAAALDEAQYAVLEASLRRMDAEKLAATR